ncbi:protein of unknown function DUF342 [Desulfovibrio sp. X2]|uniref:DUF342 domain-containing protein n=1 Tax=Desulfovibrio sp. X2 TaxID=941449 RepID=UPI0003589EB9|nr:FapA family protein [Desulfovibrio sp. X2]EPR43929.1 protein of unknown function DUF342 [Desulfovibrio sp. X2]
MSTGSPNAPHSPSEILAQAGYEIPGDMSAPVFKGMCVARPVPESGPEPGADPGGQDDLPPLPVAPQFFRIDPESGEVFSKGFGMVEFREGILSIRPQLKVCEEKTLLRATVRHKDFSGHEVTVERLAAVVTGMGVTAPVDRAALMSALARARGENAPVRDVVLAKGRRPQRGSDGRFDLYLDEDGAVAPDADDAGSVDHRARSVFCKVREGQLLGRLVPPVPGTPGVDVFGRELPVGEVHAVSVTPGEGVRVAARGAGGAEKGGGGQDFFATRGGVLSWKGETLSVLDVIDVAGDVDFSTGDVRLEKGCINVAGSIMDGFTIEIPGDVNIKGAVQADAVVRTGAGVRVGSGIFGGEKGVVEAAGSVSAQFMENARIRAGEDVVAVQDIINCDITAGGRVICVQGKGVIQGGIIRAMRGVEARETGSEYGARTVFRMGPQEPSTARKDLLATRTKLKDVLARIEAGLGTDDPTAILQRTPLDKRRQVARLLRIRIAGQARLREIECLLEEERLCLLECARSRLKVLGTAHPGTTVVVLGSTFEVHETLRSPTISFDPESGAFEVV